MRRPESFEEKLFWFLATSYVGSAVDLLHKDKALKLAHLGEQYGGTVSWQEQVEGELGINKTLIRTVFKACIKKMTTEEALCFIVRGLGCTSAESRVHEALGSELAD